MRPRRTPLSNTVYQLPGGNEDTDLWCQRVDGQVRSEWEPNDRERAALAAGAAIELALYNEPIPPISMRVVVPFCRGCKTEKELAKTDDALGYAFKCSNGCDDD